MYRQPHKYRTLTKDLQKPVPEETGWSWRFHPVSSPVTSQCHGNTAVGRVPARGPAPHNDLTSHRPNFTLFI